MSSGEPATNASACQLCRQKKRRCDGDGSNPCKACLNREADCVYVVPDRVSKGDLRDEVARLQSISSDDNAILDTIASKDTSPAQLDNILRRLSGGQPRAQVASLVSHRPVAQNHLEIDAAWETPPSLAAATPLSDAVPTELVSSQSSTSPPGLAGDRSSPSLAHLQETANKAAEFRSSLSHCRSQLPQLLSTILSRDCLLFCPISQPDLKRDFTRDYATHCSAALVDSLLAMGALAAKDHARLATALAIPSCALDPDSLAQAFADEAIFALHNSTGRPRRIADIQAFGILSLYNVACYRLKQAAEFAGDFCAAIAELWRADRPSETHASSGLDRIEHAGLYCAAVSLTRVLFLILDYHKTLDAYARSVGITPVQAVQDLEMPAVPLQVNLSNTIIDEAFFRRDLGLIPDDPVVISAKLFELTEWAYEARAGMQRATFDHAVRAYQQGLRWYESFFRYTSSCGERNASLILFIHTFYHFCVLCILTPHILQILPIAADGTRTEAVCKQAADSICELIEHYSQMHVSEKLPGFVPMFKWSALSSLTISEASARR